MFYNFRNPVILFLLSFLGMMIGMALRILHYPGGHLITGSMMMVQVIAIIWLIVLLIKTRKQ